MKIFNNFKSSLIGINGVTYINGVKIEGAQSTTIDNGKVYVDGNLQEDCIAPSIEIKVDGSVDSINTTSGDITVNGDVNSINTASGDVTCGDVAGSVSTMSGDGYQK